MHIVSGGSFKGKEYSWMYDVHEQYEFLSVDGKYYYMPAVLEDRSETPHNVLLVLEVESDKIVHAEEFREGRTWDEKIEETIIQMERKFLKQNGTDI